MATFIIRFFARGLLAGALFTVSAASGEDFNLPNLGNTSTSLFSPEQEYQLGRAWLRLFRRGAPILQDDPLLQDYVERLVRRLAAHSELQDKRIEVVIVDNPVINAFAVPGGVIGVHTGLLLYAQSEDELAMVLAHEIAHLSQRHFSRGVEQQRRQQPITMAGLLSSAVLAATSGGAAGLAALSATQAASQASALRYSRSNEREADRIGMQTLVDAGMDPHAAPRMFERMLVSSRRSRDIPEFLRTHPLSENRVSDTRSRALQYPEAKHKPDLSYQLMRARVQAHHEKVPQDAVALFRSGLAGEPLNREAARYGLALSLLRAGQPAAARKELTPLRQRRPQRKEYLIVEAQLAGAAGAGGAGNQAAIQSLEAARKSHPGDYPLAMAYAEALMGSDQPHLAEDILRTQSHRRSQDPGVWYLLAEVQGLSGNILGLHQSRAEYFLLYGLLDEAETQLEYAQRLAKEDYHAFAKISQRLKDVEDLRERMRL